MRNSPQFYAAPNSKKGQSKQKNAFDFAEFVKTNQPDFAVIEPTGNHYSRLWATILQALGVEILWVGHAELRAYRKGQGLPAKTDQADALALAGYPLEPLGVEKWGIKLKALPHPPTVSDRRIAGTVSAKSGQRLFHNTSRNAPSVVGLACRSPR